MECKLSLGFSDAWSWLFERKAVIGLYDHFIDISWYTKKNKNFSHIHYYTYLIKLLNIVMISILLFQVDLIKYNVKYLLDLD